MAEQDTDARWRTASTIDARDARHARDAQEPRTAAADHPRGEAPRAYLYLLDGDSSRRVELPEDGELVIGRGDAATLRVLDASVSRQHARVRLRAGRAQIEDLGSQNGTAVNGEPVVGSRALASGDLITLSEVSLVYRARGARPPPSLLIDLQEFRKRSALELERALKYQRPASVLCLQAAGPLDRAVLAPKLDACARPIDLGAWLSASALALVLPEADAEAAEAQGLRVLEALGEPSHARVGIACCPSDGGDLDTLLLAAREACRADAGDRTVSFAKAAYRVIRVGAHDVVIADVAMARLYSLLERLARAELSILLCGETGAGKELAATAVHQLSPRASGPFVAVNCAAIQETLIESELFGHERGAFTGAVAQKVGLLEAANGGTVFLDELGELSLSAQAKLLRALETRRITRLGDTRERAIDIRLVAATHRNLEDEVKAGRFRQDLYFRLNGAVVWLPPLRDRPRELPILARTFLTDACARGGRDSLVLSDAAMQVLLAHAWPGNVRELKNLMEYLAAAVDEEVIEPWHLAHRLSGAGARPRVHSPESQSVAAANPQAFRPLADEVRELERARMQQALTACGWNQTRAAQAIGMPLRTFVTKLRQYDLHRSRTEPTGG